MLLKRLYNDKLAQASYLIGCPASGEAIVIDPNRDVDQYIRAAEKERLRITAVTETHIHADYLSGARELAKRTGAKLYLSDEGDQDWKYAFAEDAGAQLVRDGDSIRVGAARLDVIKTPGHTPEHITFMITDEAASSKPLGAFTGDFIFVGDVGRPDLLEQAAGIAGTMEPAARDLYHSLQRFKQYPSHLLLWPGHGAGSACGKALGAVPVSSLGYEQISNWALKAADESGFVREVLTGQPDPPPYFAMMKRLNKQGPPLLGEFSIPPRRLDGHKIPGLLEDGALIVDVRDSDVYAHGHIYGTLNIPADSSFITWAGWLIPYDKDIMLIAQDEHEAEQAVRDLQLIGLDRVVSWFGADALDEYLRLGGTLEPIPQLHAPELLRKRGEYTVVDVRGPSEWSEGHLAEAHLIPLGMLESRAGEIPHDKPLAVHCAGGGRSPIAASLLRKLGFRHVLNIPEGYDELGKLDREQPVTA